MKRATLLLLLPLAALLVLAVLWLDHKSGNAAAPPYKAL